MIYNYILIALGNTAVCNSSREYSHENQTRWLIAFQWIDSCALLSKVPADQIQSKQLDKQDIEMTNMPELLKQT